MHTHPLHVSIVLFKLSNLSNYCNEQHAFKCLYIIENSSSDNPVQVVESHFIQDYLQYKTFLFESIRQNVVFIGIGNRD